MHLKHKTAVALLATLALAVPGGAHAATRTPRIAHAPVQGMVASPDTCDPFSDWDDDVGNGDDGTTNKLLPGLLRLGGEGHGSPTGNAAQVIGTTPAEIEHRFVRVVTANLANAGTASRIARLSDKELGAIAWHAGQGAATDRAQLLKLFATRLDAASLVRVAHAFGRAPVQAAVHAYASPEIRAAFDAEAAGFAPPPEGGGGGGGGGGSYPRPNLNMTLEEIYLEFRTAPVGSLSPAASLAETSMYAGGWLYLAYKTGDKVGTEIHELIETYDPRADATLGEIIGSMVENFWLATDAVEQGHYEAAFDDLFGFPVTNSSDPWGDWDVSDLMIDYYNWSETCGY
ncbi:MAG TPA: hypothetical protein VFT52_02420 [Luteimonas sp.]|jgi:hypothetical protein|nr:hypothetical protein [Luteimonas sp.]